MEIVLTRRWRGQNTTLSTLQIDGAPHHFVLEDTDRGLLAGMKLNQIKTLKVPGRTAIPEGQYQVIITHSERFKRQVPLLADVPGFAGIRIHPGNRHIDTEGCLLPGSTWRKDSDGNYVLGSSLTACNNLTGKIRTAIGRGEKVWITIKSAYVNDQI